MTRLRFVGLMLALWAGALALRLAWLQWLGAGELRALGARQFKVKVVLPPRRGLLLDRRGRVLAGPEPALTLYQYGPVEDPQGVLDELKIKPKPYDERRTFVLARGLPLELKERFKKVKGVYTRVGEGRLQALGEAGAPLIGKVGLEGRGLWGLELALDEFLRGEPGYEVMFRTADGKRLALPNPQRKDPIPGWDITLTVDAELQEFCYWVIAETVRDENARAGFVLVSNPKTGEILAAAQYPPTWRLFAATDPYELGSVMKPFILAKALEEGLVDLDRPVPLKGGPLLVGGYPIRDAEPMPKGFTWRDALVHSSNRAFALLALTLGRKRVYEVIRRFGFFSRTDALVPGEFARRQRWENWRRSRLANLGMGQGILVNGFQMLMAYGAIANGGWLLAPRLLLKMERAGREIEFSEPKVVRRALSDSLARVLRQILVEVVEEGTGKAARIPGVKVAGKTGTAQKVKKGRYSQDVVSSFIGFFPADDPRWLIYVVVDEPKRHHYGGEVAAPAFKKIAQFILNRRKGGEVI